ncbi:hypothetical protein BBO99_00002544 [Phytophthora kernoviae]|uniref:Trimethylguanosine synthase n=2 Tax=Phytophthora kernoviae TaxID=325452 RepID=A0A3R7IM34_9STRA|nr:hypothetical protein G195_002920 [Phytophthora kernoviae 00238/432]KAG2524485.1 hypothetical protein JM16_004916 [Phytophthora kernoviae]KAG2530601.1 hypothetical protein JM18_002080 [Phytophthora kernoviae]RLN36824.1 hypothetical protein BBI17_002364 [Phytophthora kernoviae]RLN82950.1 hypothetical protein BBO99_00002544 [Phytophthora kernoviae]
MVVETEIRLRSRKGQTTTESPLRRKPSKRQRLHEKTKAPPPPDPCAELYEAAQAQLQQEMLAAGMEGSLPMSFGTSRKRQRSLDEAEEEVHEVETVDLTVEEEDTANKDLQLEDEGEVEVEVDGVDDTESAITKTTILNKVRVIYDSDGEVAERVVEQVEVTVEVKPEESSHEIVQHKNSAPDDSKAKGKKKKKEKGHPYPVPKDVVKFYMQRHILFYKFEDGILLDHESWYSVTPQAIAEHIAQRLSCDVVVDPFTGCGGNVIQLAKTCKQVIAIDIDPEKIRMAKHNAAIYGVADKIEWIVGNSIEILPKLKADAVFLSPPWGGVNYNRNCFSLDDMLVDGVSGVELFALARKVTKNIAYYVPRTTPTEDLEALSPKEPVECEKIFLNKQQKVLTAYYGNLAVTDKQVTNSDSPSNEVLIT